MKSIHILISRHYGFEETHYTELWFNQIRPILSKYFSIQLTWLLFLPKKNAQQIPKNDNVIHIQDFNNAIQIIETLKPDLIISNEFPNLIDLSLYEASKNFDSFFIKNNPYIALNFESLQKTPSIKIKKFTPFISAFLSLFYAVNDYQHEQKYFRVFSRLNFIFFKLKFFLRTLILSKSKFNVKYNIFSSGIKFLINQTVPYVNRTLSADLEFCSVSSLYDLICKNNNNISNIVLVGDPIYDEFFKKRNLNKIKKPSKKIEVLLAPTTIVAKSGHTMKKDTLKLITTKLSKNKDEFDLFVKLHPTSDSLQFYKKHIHSIDDSILLYQKGSIEPYVELSDVVITFTHLTSAIIFPLILRKPIILCNFFNVPLPDNIEQIAFVCTNPDDLQNIILEACEKNHEKYNNIDLYLKSISHNTDGTSAQQITNSIISLFDQRSVD